MSKTVKVPCGYCGKRFPIPKRDWDAECAHIEKRGGAARRWYCRALCMKRWRFENTGGLPPWEDLEAILAGGKRIV